MSDAVVATDKPLVTVMVPTYNRAFYLKLSIDSILKQDYENIEILVLDNCSTDNTQDVIAGYSDVRIRYIKNDRNLGIIGNHNKGLDLAKGEYIHLFSDDDIMNDAGNISSKVNIMLNYHNVGVVHGSIITINSDDEVTAGNWAESLAHWPSVTSSPLMRGAEAFKLLYYKWNFVNMPAALIRKSVLTQANIEFSNQLRFLLDWDLWLKISLFSDFYYMATPMISYRVHQKNITKSMLSNSYFVELLEMKVALISLFPDSEIILKEISEIESVVKIQTGWPNAGQVSTLKSKILNKISSLIPVLSK